MSITSHWQPGGRRYRKPAISGQTLATQQREHASRLILAVTLIAQQAVQEATRRRSQLVETLAQQRQQFRRTVARPVGRVQAALPAGAARQQPMPGNLGDG